LIYFIRVRESVGFPQPDALGVHRTLRCHACRPAMQSSKEEGERMSQSNLTTLQERGRSRFHETDVLQRTPSAHADSEAPQRAKSALAASPIYLLRQLQVEHVDDCLLLSGRVDTYYHKQLAQEVVRAVSDGMQVVNFIDVD
jgi:hypothetical protein